MTIESIITVFSIALLSLVVLFLIIGIIFSLVSKSRQKRTSDDISQIQKVKQNTNSFQVDFNRIPCQVKLNYTTVNHNFGKTSTNTKQYKLSSNPNSTHSSFYQVFNSSKNSNPFDKHKFK